MVIPMRSLWSGTKPQEGIDMPWELDQPKGSEAPDKSPRTVFPYRTAIPL